MTGPTYDAAALKFGPMRYRLLSIPAFVVFVASMSSIAESSCKDHSYQTECGEDPSCTWATGSGKNARPHCKDKEVFTGCASHRSEIYCAPNGCRWDSEARKCTDKGSGH